MKSAPIIRTMSWLQEALRQLAAIENSQVLENECLAHYTRFAIGGPAAVLFDTADEEALLSALQVVDNLGVARIVIGGGTNLVVADAGFAGVVLRYTGAAIRDDGPRLCAAAGAELQSVVDKAIELGLRGLETMTGIPGYMGGAVYGNAGAYGHSIQELVQSVRLFDGKQVLDMQNADCEFRYRDSVFKGQKNWIILSADLRLETDDRAELARTASEIRQIRDAKYPPSMKCAGSIFKNLLLTELPPWAAAGIPEKVVRDGKVPSAWFLEQVGAKGMRRGDIQIADYHANLIYNDGAGTAADLVALIREVKIRVQDRFGFEVEEEVQYVGFNGSGRN